MKAVKRFFTRFTIGFQLFILGFRKSNVFTLSNFERMCELYEQVWKTASRGDPQMMKIATVHPEKNDEVLPLVSVWVGPGVDADPWDRVRELRKENEYLREQLRNGDQLEETKDQ